MTEQSDLDVRKEQVIRVDGSIDITNSEDFRDRVSVALKSATRVTIDVSEVDMLDSSAIGVLAKAHQEAKKTGVDLSLTVSNNLTMRILQLSGLAEAFGLCVLQPKFDNRLQTDNPDLRRQDWRITESVAVAEREMVAPLRDVAMTAAEEIGIKPESIAEIKIALTEALANALFHGSPRPGRSRIGMRCLSCEEAIVLEVTDEGKGVDAEEIAAMQTGLGTKLMKAVMDEVEFHRTERGGRVRMIKWIRDRC